MSKLKIGIKKKSAECASPVLACIGDSITEGGSLPHPDKDSYPALLQNMLGESISVENFGVGSCTLIRKGEPNVWSQLEAVRQSLPRWAVISLGTNDTCGGERACWDHRDEFQDDCKDLIDEIRTLPSSPHLWICKPTPMVLETPGLTPERRKDLETRRSRLDRLIRILEQISEENDIGLIDLHTPLLHRPELFFEGDGIHPNEAGNRRIAELVYQAVGSML